MTKHLVFAGLIVVFFTSCNSYRRQVRSLSPQCQALLKEMKYRIIKNDTGGYTFRFEHPVSDTIPKSETPRDLEFQNFCYTILKTDSLCKCNLNKDLITHTIGKPNKQYLFDIYSNYVSYYSLDFGFNCGGNKCPGSSDNDCNHLMFVFDVRGKLIKYYGYHNTFDIEPYYCSSNALEYILRKEKEEREKKLREKTEQEKK